MLLMAQACFDPAEASQVWRRMETLAQGPQPPAFLSTHPGHRERIEKINGWLPEARKRFEDAGCYEGGNAGLLDGFFGRK
jgi:predicted Zn-dependent protease